ncbi:MAG: DUF502 domain-containing protein [Alphaproteobacteria bacterium]|nr:DUF502 domain-containing protein [Alphaproteobacteria bacterium]MCB9928371.1 DUF502 domain-containing protein [Alphaproteobacteria bacterium]
MTEQRTNGGFLRRRARRIRRSFAARIRTYFFAGVLVTAPITITVWLAIQIIDFFDSTVRNLIPAGYNPEALLPFSIPGVGLVVFIVGVTLIGALAAGMLGRFFMRTAERIVNTMPVVRTIYNALKQILETVLQSKSEAFRQVVLLEYPRRGIWCLGFVSAKTEGEVQNLTDQDMLNVFLPTTPNPTSGFLLFLPKRDVYVLDMTVEEGIKMVVSGGLVTPPDRKANEHKADPPIHVASIHDEARADEAAAQRRLQGA